MSSICCNICGKMYSTKSSLGRHIREKHSASADDVATFPCSFCTKTYSLKRTLDNHIKDCHTEQHSNVDFDGNFNCDECEDQTFKTAEEMALHCCNVVNLVRFGRQAINSRSVQVHHHEVRQQLEFDSEGDFDCFRASFEEEHKSQYVQCRGIYHLANGTHAITYICRRSNETKHQSERRNEKLIRTHASVQLDENCLSRCRVTIRSDGTISATLYQKHTGHNTLTDHFKLFDWYIRS